MCIYRTISSCSAQLAVVIPASESSQKNVCCRLHRVQIQMFVCFFLLFVCYTSIRKFTKERGRTQPIVCTPGCIGFRFRCLCVSSPSNFSAKVLRQKAAARRHKLTLQKSNTLIWTQLFLSLCKELQSLCWSSGKTKLLKKWRKLLRRHRPRTASATRNTLRKSFRKNLFGNQYLL